jgi:hypothetical protein
MTRKKAVRILLASLLTIAILLSGCSGMPISTMVKLRGYDPMMADPAQVRIAIRADQRITIPDGGAVVALRFKTSDGELHIDDTYIVEIVRNPVLTEELIDGKRRGEAVTVLRLSDKDAEKMTRAQALLKSYIDSSQSGALTFGVDLRDLCVSSSLPAGDVLVDIFMQTTDDGGYFVFTKDLNPLESSGIEDVTLESLPVCGAWSENPRFGGSIDC